MPHTTRKNAREWQRLWRAGEIITEIDGGRSRDARARPARAEGARLAPGLRGRKSTAAHKEPSR